MKTLQPTLCCLLVALVVLFSSGFATALVPTTPSHPAPFLAQTQVMASAPGNHELPSHRSTTAIEANSMAYLEIIVIPLLLFILMVGVVRKQKI
ncbi:MAG: hypothetical protein JWO94_1825 [Verrucomicrobiaceae bacterium]|nr:hypothetical protein [Verrucomicrobiaceae bacterium]